MTPGNKRTQSDKPLGIYSYLLIESRARSQTLPIITAKIAL